ncbi:MAG: undecaprenyl/decaprenyl-phosphate alpha-N-acetylglucosaminyl 1-phosphate transferase [Candidatus Magasanikbacteria bacterium]|nr:undecaprenyl/decaprenyl-phosphate alpha-N-acetylglucosaminyl 1-phosphate transferase [Candidatus Magasanikbacteria bacterium]
MVLFPFFIAALISCLLTPVVALLMTKLKIVDNPRAHERKIHHGLMPLGGGLAIFLTFFGIVSVGLVSGLLTLPSIPILNLWAVFVGAAVLMIGGWLDDAYQIRPRYQIIFPLLASAILIGVNFGPEIITNPLGGTINLAHFFSISGTALNIANLVLFAWLMGMMFTTKFLDGLDGLVAGMTAIAGLVIFFLTQQAAWYQPDVSFLALLLSGASVGFLIWNWNPAKIFLGEGGSLLAGYLIGVLAVISGSKIITTLLVMGIPALDVGRVIFARLKRGHTLSTGDSEHLHFKLIKAGMSQRQAVGLYYGVALVFGLSTLFLSNLFKLIAFAILVGIFWFIIFTLEKGTVKKSEK